MKPKCYKGKLSKIKYVGLIPDLQDPDFELDFCGNPQTFPSIDDCSRYAMDLPSFESEYEIKCQGQSNCGLNIIQYLIDDQERKNCSSDFAQVYLQYSCDFEDIMLSQNMKGLIVTISGIIVCIIFRFSIYFRRTMSDIDANIWDIDTVTTADFAVQVNLTN